MVDTDVDRWGGLEVGELLSIWPYMAAASPSFSSADRGDRLGQGTVTAGVSSCNDC